MWLRENKIHAREFPQRRFALMNTAIAEAEDSEKMALAMKLVESGRLAYLAGRMPKKLYATASSPLSGVVR